MGEATVKQWDAAIAWRWFRDWWSTLSIRPKHTRVTAPQRRSQAVRADQPATQPVANLAEGLDIAATVTESDPENDPPMVSNNDGGVSPVPRGHRRSDCVCLDPSPDPPGWAGLVATYRRRWQLGAGRSGGVWVDRDRAFATATRWGHSRAVEAGPRSSQSSARGTWNGPEGMGTISSGIPGT